MQISDLVAVGKLGKIIDKNGFITFKVNDGFQPFSLTDVFLVFTDNRVRYVTIEEIETRKGFNIKIDDMEVAREAAEDGSVLVMLQKEETDKLQEKNDKNDLLGKKVIFKGKRIGLIIDIFNNSFYDVLVIEMNNGKELMIPMVDFYIEKIENDSVFSKNIEDLMEL